MEKYAIFIDGQGKTDMLEERVLFERSPLSFSVRAFVYLQKEADDKLAVKDAEIAALRYDLDVWLQNFNTLNEKVERIEAELTAKDTEIAALKQARDSSRSSLDKACEEYRILSNQLDAERVNHARTAAEIAALRAQLEKSDALASAVDEELEFKSLTTKVCLIDAANVYKEARHAG